MKLCLILIISCVAGFSASVGVVIEDEDVAGAGDEEVTASVDVNASVSIAAEGSDSPPSPSSPNGSGAPIGIGVPKIIAGAGLAADGAADIFGLGGQVVASETGQVGVSNNGGSLAGSASKNVAGEVGGLGPFAGGFGGGLAAGFGGFGGYRRKF